VVVLGQVLRLVVGGRGGGGGGTPGHGSDVGEGLWVFGCYMGESNQDARGRTDRFSINSGPVRRGKKEETREGIISKARKKRLTWRLPQSLFLFSPSPVVVESTASFFVMDVHICRSTVLCGVRGRGHV
jgi:hypothetical protein